MRLTGIGGRDFLLMGRLAGPLEALGITALELGAACEAATLQCLHRCSIWPSARAIKEAGGICVGASRRLNFEGNGPSVSCLKTTTPQSPNDPLKES